MCVCVCVVSFEFNLSCAYLNAGFHFAVIIFILSLYFSPHTLHPHNNIGTAIVMYEFSCMYLIFLPTQCIFILPRDLESTNFPVFIVILVNYITVHGFQIFNLLYKIFLSYYFTALYAFSFKCVIGMV